MASCTSVQRFAARVKNEVPRLDVAILNAGISPNDYVIGAEGWESVIQVNVMATALLGLLLLPKLRFSTHEVEMSRLVIVTSEAHRWLQSSDFPDPLGFGGSILLMAKRGTASFKIQDRSCSPCTSQALWPHSQRSATASHRW